MLTKLFAGATLAAVLACGFLYWRVVVATERAAAAEANLSAAQSANEGLAGQIEAQQFRHTTELAKRDQQLKAQEQATQRALKVAQQSRAAEASWQTRFNNLTRSDDACWNTALPDAVFGGL